MKKRYDPRSELGYIDEQIAECELRMNKRKEKKCPKCGKMKPCTDYYSYDTGGNEYTWWCKECIEYYIKNTSLGAN